MKNIGQRVVAGQRLLQSASDSFLGWDAEASGRRRGFISFSSHDYYESFHPLFGFSSNLT